MVIYRRICLGQSTPLVIHLYDTFSNTPFSGVLTEAYLESGRTSTMEFFAEILNSFKVLALFSKKAPRLG